MNLHFQFSSLNDLLLMSGHGPYVWAAYAITLAGLIGLVVQGRLRRKDLGQQIKLTRLKAESQSASKPTGV